MCLLIRQPEGVTFSDEWLADFYSNNADGFGFMYAAPDAQGVMTLWYNKTRGNLDVVKEVYRQVAGKRAALHFRMATHGDVDETNTHPYPVLHAGEPGGPIYLMHNGVLSTGNSRDKSKSDTWHYIDRFLRPLLLRDAGLFKDPAFKEMVEGHIGGSNKFVLMDSTGHIEVYNERSGVEWEATPGVEKAWMSNTYAWTASKAGFGGGSAIRWRNGFTWGEYDWDDHDGYRYYSTSTNTASTATPRKDSKPWIHETRTEFFTKLKTLGLDEAWKELSVDDWDDFCEREGEEEARDVIKLLDPAMSDEDVIDWVLGDSGANLEPEAWVKQLRYELFLALDRLGYRRAFSSLNSDEVEAFLIGQGVVDAETFLGFVEQGAFDDDQEVVDYVRSYLPADFAEKRSVQ